MVGRRNELGQDISMGAVGTQRQADLTGGLDKMSDSGGRPTSGVSSTRTAAAARRYLHPLKQSSEWT